MRKLIYTLVVLFSMSFVAIGQGRIIKGKVSDPNSTPMEGVAIRLQSKTASATLTNAKGEFSIKADNGDVLLLTYVGYQAEKVKVTASTSELNLVLNTMVNTMDEVVVTAGGIKTKKKELGNASTLVRSDALMAGKSVTVAGGLQGKVAGLQINATGGGVNPSFRIVLRGQRSLTGNNEALIVLDNIIVPNEVLSNLNPEDVENVNVLNGAGASALYGSSASNGAIIITTKKGKKGINAISIANTTSYESVAFFPKFQTGFGAGGTTYGYNTTFSNLENQSYGPAYDGSKRLLGSPLEDGSQDSAYYSYNPGHKKFWETGVTNQTDFSLSSGDENSTFYFSGQYVGVTGTTPGDKYNRTVVRLNGTRKVGEKINIAYNTSYTQNRYDITTQTGSMYGNMLNMPAHVDITRFKNWRTDKFANPIGFYNPWYQNPYFSADNYRQGIRNDYLTANVEIKFTPIKTLDIVARQGITTRNTSNKSWNGEFIYTDYSKHTQYSSKADIAGNVADGAGYTTNLLTDFFFQHTKKFNDFSTTLIGGIQWRQDQTKSVNVSASGLVIPDLYNVSNGVGTPGASESNAMARQLGTYADFRVGYKNYLFLHATGRQDKVSVLAKKNNTFFYPAVDVSFIATDALPALTENGVISYLKLRGGWSKVGQVNLGGSFGAYQLLPTFSAGAGFPYGSLPGYTVGNTLVSNDLKPEVTKGYEVGFDLNLFKDKITTSVTYFNTTTDNQTVNTSVSNATGYTGLRTNTGQTSSKGFEITAHATPVNNTNGWKVTFGGNYTYLDNNVNFISADLPRLALATYTDNAGSYAVAGRAFPVIMGFDYNRDAQGRVIVNAVTGLPTKSDTISVLGSAVAKHKLGLDFSVGFKNLKLTALVEYRGGYEAFHSMGSEMDWSGTGYRTTLYNRESFIFPNSSYWNGTQYVANTNVSIANGNGNNGFWSDGINREVTSNYLTSGAFWKLRELAISYDLPTSFVAKSKFIKGVNLSVQGRNLFVIMAKDNYYTDPEYSDAGSGSNGMGLTGISQTPPSRYYGATIRFKF
jgi:TonB-linked SusC/RagA family outer membrane protein